MSETKFTPGEWEQHDRMRDCVTFIGHEGTENLFLSNVEGYYACQNEYDAALISCAKHLYAAAVETLAELDFIDNPTDAQRARRQALFALVQRARGE